MAKTNHTNHDKRERCHTPGDNHAQGKRFHPPLAGPGELCCPRPTLRYEKSSQRGQKHDQDHPFRDQRSNCKQDCIGLVVSRCGMPLGYEVFAGNTADVTTVEPIVETMEQRYGKSTRIWVMDRGLHGRFDRRGSCVSCKV
ncbi:MAG: hypothetical protein AB7U20_00790 [Planctomycetaceae bacterium]